MFKRVVILLCVFALISSISCKKKDNADGADAGTDALIESIFGDGPDSDGDFLAADPTCGDAECNGDETKESCPVDCSEAGTKIIPTTYKLKIVPGESPLKLYEQGYFKSDQNEYIVVKMNTSFKGTVEITGPEFVGDSEECVSIELLDKGDDEVNKAYYQIYGEMEGECEVVFKAVNVEDAEEIYEDKVTFVVEKNMIENKTSKEFETKAISFDIQTNKAELKLNLNSKKGSGVCAWDPIKVDWVDTLGGLTSPQSFEYSVATFDQTKCDTETNIIFNSIGKAQITTVVSDPDLGYSSEKIINVTISDEEIAPAIYLLTGADHMVCLEDIACRKTLDEARDPVTKFVTFPYGASIAIIKDGTDDYWCENNNSLFTIPVASPENKKIACLLTYGGEPLEVVETLSNQSVIVKSTYGGDDMVDMGRFIFEADPCSQDIKIVVVKPESTDSDDTTPKKIAPVGDFEPTEVLDMAYNSTIGLTDVNIQFKAEGGDKANYIWSFTSNAGLINGVDIATPQSTETKLSSPDYSESEPVYTELSESVIDHHAWKWDHTCDTAGTKDKGCLDLTGDFRYEWSEYPKGNPYIDLTVSLDDQCADSLGPVVKKYKIYMKYPGIKTENTSDLRLKVTLDGLSETEGDGSTYMEVALVGQKSLLNNNPVIEDSVSEWSWPQELAHATVDFYDDCNSGTDKCPGPFPFNNTQVDTDASSPSIVDSTLNDVDGVYLGIHDDGQNSPWRCHYDHLNVYIAEIKIQGKYWEAVSVAELGGELDWACHYNAGEDDALCSNGSDSLKDDHQEFITRYFYYDKGHCSSDEYDAAEMNREIIWRRRAQPDYE